MSKELRIAVIGDDAVGKTNLIHVLMNKPFTQEYVPTILEEYVHVHNNTKITFVDTPGNEDYAKIRTTQYNGINVFLIVFSLDHHKAFDRLHYWVEDDDSDEEGIGEVKSDISIRHVSSAPFVIIGNKSDLRKTSPQKVNVTFEEAKKRSQELGAINYIEVSSLEKINIDKLMEEIFHAATQEGNAKKISSDGLPFEEGILKVTAVKGTDLRIGDSNGTSDPYFVFGTYNKGNFKALGKSKTKFKTLNPVWNETLEINLSARKIKGTEGIAIQLWDADLIGRDFLGIINYSWDLLPKLFGHEQTVSLHEDEFEKEKVGVKGTVTFSIDFKKHDSHTKLKSSVNLTKLKN
eukprot:TRINITY_DN1258_c0_g1_i1.p1 TRINITY_DN1258_c0_g1~~TRINITY_DN1258_c0_g1_i1.p1  ORF type:complete len:349 (+),score=104.24 TRINITY_DN1258_c0_g1_i1:229-1275(+)